MSKQTIDINLESLLIREVAGEVLGKLSEEEKAEILKSAITSKLSNVDFWELRKAIDTEVVKLAAEYMQEPDVRTRLRETAIAKVEEIVEGLFDMFGKGMENWAKAEWARILKVKEEKSN